ncbi:hypothetical protein HID58_085783 [Brassica napus]|uniref:Disease resistance protein n=1 Tax=Brassica napus TaxID=3708 RepID=A0ABQ7XNM7_BRANA|nr:hypothetical protein HID58_085783 [Brassica napus]
MMENEARMIEKISKDVLDKLNATPSRDFCGMVGIEIHLMKVLIFSSRFQLSCFVNNLRGSHHSGFDEHGLKLHLQNQLLSQMLNQNDMRISHLGALKERLCDHRVLIILDDVNSIKQLEALANETTWFGPGSRIVVTTENNELMQQHGINYTYHVVFPSDEQALKILCRYAFRQSYPHICFKELALRVTKLCGNLPLGLRVVGSSLRGKNEEEWEEVILKLDTILDHQDIEEVLKVGYESLHENELSLFLHIAVFFNYNDVDFVKSMFADNNLDIKHGLKILVSRSLIHVSTDGEIVMHKLLQQVGRKAVRREEPWKCRILIETPDICDVLERAKGSRAVSGILFDISDIDEVSISSRAFKRMPNLRFLKIYKSKEGGNDIENIPEDIEFPPRLRLLHWEAYPNKCLPPTFHPEYLVQLNLRDNELEKLWEGTQRLQNLQKLDLFGSLNFKELPDLSNASNLDSLDLSGCESLVEIPSSFRNLHKLKQLTMLLCIKLQVVPDHFNLASLTSVVMVGCWKLRKLPGISRNITSLSIADTMLEELPESVRLWSRLETLSIYGSLNISPIWLDRWQERKGADIVTIPDWIKDLHGLTWLHGLSKTCLPSSLRKLTVETCLSLVYFPFDSQVTDFFFPHCFKLCPEARSVIIQKQGRMSAYLPGGEIPWEFEYQATGNALTIPFDIYRFRICVVISPKREHIEDVNLVTTSQDVDITECGVQVLREETDGSIGSQESYDDECLSDVSNEPSSQQVYDNLSGGNSDSCSEQVSEDEDKSLS